MEKKKSLILLSALCLVCVVGMILALTLGRRTEVRFEPPPFDSEAVVGTPSEVNDDSYGELDATAYRFSLCGSPSSEDGAALLWLTNPESNEVLLKVRILNTAGDLLGESGLLRPGEYVRSVALTEPLTAPVDVVLTVMAYEPETYYSMGNVRLNTQLSAE